MLAFPHRLRFSRDARRILLVPASHTRRVRAQTRRGDHSVERQVTQRIGPDIVFYLFHTHLRGYQFRLVRRIDSVIARTDRRWTTDAHVNLLRARLANHAHDLFRSRATHDRIVDQDHALAVY